MSKYRELLNEYPVRLRANKERGRYVVASNVLNPGQLLLKEHPTAFTIFKQCAQDYCQTCLKTLETTKSTRILGLELCDADIVTCTSCRKQSFWCSEECKENDKVHGIACPFLIELPGIAGSASVDYNLLRLALHIIIRASLEAEKQQLGTPFECLQSLKSHQKSFDKTMLDAFKIAFADYAEMFRDTQYQDISLDWMLKLACRINSNSHAVHDPSGNSNAAIGVGMFPLVAMLNHSCTPNAVFVTENKGEMHVRAVKCIAPGEEVCVSYVDLFAPKWERQGLLLSSKFFWCTCSRCSPVANDTCDSDYFMDCIKCSECPGYMIPDTADQFRCNGCSKITSNATVDKVTALVDISNGMDLYRAGMFDSAQIALEKSLSIADSKLHPHHYLKLTILVNLISLCSRQNLFVLAAQYAQRAINQMIYIADDASLGLYIPELANLYEKHSELLEIITEGVKQNLIEYDDLSLLESSQHQLQKCLEIRRICFGSQ